jgi:sugar phosphate isomerase/epimerase
LQDNLGQRDDHMPPGQGTIDWAALFGALAQVGYSRTLMLELTDRAAHRPYDRDLELAQGARNTAQSAAQYLAPSGQGGTPG